MAANTISPQQFFDLCREGNVPLLVDVRTPAEFGEVHATQAQNISLDRLSTDSLPTTEDTVYLICKTGKRAESAAERLGKSGLSNTCCITGGTEGWESAGLPVNRGKATISLERQVRIAAGGLVATGAILALTINPMWAILPALVGCGLVFAGITDTCGMGMMLAKMPWNQASGSCCGTKSGNCNS